MFLPTRIVLPQTETEFLTINLEGKKAQRDSGTEQRELRSFNGLDVMRQKVIRALFASIDQMEI